MKTVAYDLDKTFFIKHDNPPPTWWASLRFLLTPLSLKLFFLIFMDILSCDMPFGSFSILATNQIVHHKTLT